MGQAPDGIPDLLVEARHPRCEQLPELNAGIFCTLSGVASFLTVGPFAPHCRSAGKWLSASMGTASLGLHLSGMLASQSFAHLLRAQLAPTGREDAALLTFLVLFFSTDSSCARLIRGSDLTPGWLVDHHLYDGALVSGTARFFKTGLRRLVSCKAPSLALSYIAWSRYKLSRL